jgi:hypothetical protein
MMFFTAKMDEIYRFPWESAYTGVEVTSSCCPNVPMFEQHITGCISFAIRQFLASTRDEDWLKVLVLFIMYYYLLSDSAISSTLALDISPHSTDCFSYSFSVHAVQFWNSIPDNIRRARSLEFFGAQTRRHLSPKP